MDDRLDTTETASVSGLNDEHLLNNLLIDVRGLSDELSADTVPETLMVVPIHCSIQWLYQHGRRCKPRGCTHTPRPLRALLGFHSKKAIAAQHQNIYGELWRHPDFLMVEAVRSRILEVEASLAQALDDGPSMAAVQAHIDDEEDGVIRLAATLWARGLTSPVERRLFRLLPLLAPLEPDAEDTSTPSAEAEPSEKEKAKEKREKLESRVTELEAEVREQRARSRDRKKKAEGLQRDLERARKEAAAAEGRVDELQTTSESLGQELRKREREARESTKAAQSSKRLNDDYRKELLQTEQQLDRSEEELSALRRDLARALDESEKLKASLRSLPRGKNAVAAFLAAEEDEIDQDLNIKQGADKQRAKSRHALHRKLETAFLNAYPQFKAPRPAHTLGLRGVYFHALGGGAEVGRSSYLLEIGSTRVLVDCGIAVGRDPSAMAPDIADIGPLDAVILTHAHTDHIGWLPVLIRHQRNELPIYCSEETFSIAPIMLNDAHDNYRRRLAEERLIASRNPDAEEVLEEYTDDDRRDVEARLRFLRWDDPSDISGGLKLRLFKAGHILGAASALIEGGGRRVVVSGDISSEPQRTVFPARPPSDLGDVDFLVLESTYGDRCTDAGQSSRDQLVDFVRRATEEGTALLPCFALGRGQEVLRILLDAKDAKEIDQDVTIFVDGLIRKIIPTYIDRGSLPEHGYEQIRNRQARAMAIAGCQRSNARAVVVSTSGMLNGGPIVEWSRQLLSNPRHRLALLGYQDGESAGGRLRKLNDQGRPPYRLSLMNEDGELTEVKIANPVREIGLSAHADQHGLIEYARAISPGSIALVHGEPSSQAALQKELRDEMPGTTVSCPGPERLRVL